MQIFIRNYNNNKNGSTISISEDAKVFIAQQASNPVAIERGARFVTSYLENLLRVYENKIALDSRFRSDGLFTGKFNAKIELHENKTGVVVKFDPI